MIPFHKVDIDELKSGYSRVDNLGRNRIEEGFAGKALKNVWLKKRSDDWNQKEGVGKFTKGKDEFEFSEWLDTVREDTKKDIPSED